MPNSHGSGDGNLFIAWAVPPWRRSSAYGRGRLSEEVAEEPSAGCYRKAQAVTSAGAI
jgi:hypothetical protein